MHRLETKTKRCKVCNEKKDIKEGFYKTSGRTCRLCKDKQGAERAKEVKGLQVSLLLEIRDSQAKLIERIEELEEKMDKWASGTEETDERVDKMEEKVAKIRKALKKLSVT